MTVGLHMKDTIVTKETASCSALNYRETSSHTTEHTEAGHTPAWLKCSTRSSVPGPVQIFSALLSNGIDLWAHSMAAAIPRVTFRHMQREKQKPFSKSSPAVFPFELLDQNWPKRVGLPWLAVLVS